MCSRPAYLKCRFLSCLVNAQCVRSCMSGGDEWCVEQARGCIFLHQHMQRRLECLSSHTDHRYPTIQVSLIFFLWCLTGLSSHRVARRLPSGSPWCRRRVPRWGHRWRYGV